MNRQRDTLRGLAGGIFLGCFLIGLAFTVFFGLGYYFVTLLFLGLACSSLLGMMSTFDPKKAYGGLQGFIWFLGLAILFLPQVAFWPWGVGGFLIICGISSIVGALAKPIIAGINGMRIMSAASQTNQQPQPADEPLYQPYKQGYQPLQQVPETYQEGGQLYAYPTQPEQQNDQPQLQPSQQEEALLHQY